MDPRSNKTQEGKDISYSAYMQFRVILKSLVYECRKFDNLVLESSDKMLACAILKMLMCKSRATP